MNGQVRNTNERGFAFVRGEDGEDYFLHASQLRGMTFQELRQHDTVSFQPADGLPGKGPIATNAERVKRAAGFTDEVGCPDAPAPGRWPSSAGRAADQDARRMARTACTTGIRLVSRARPTLTRARVPARRSPDHTQATRSLRGSRSAAWAGGNPYSSYDRSTSVGVSPPDPRRSAL